MLYLNNMYVPCIYVVFSVLAAYQSSQDLHPRAAMSCMPVSYWVFSKDNTFQMLWSITTSGNSKNISARFSHNKKREGALCMYMYNLMYWHVYNLLHKLNCWKHAWMCKTANWLLQLYSKYPSIFWARFVWKPVPLASLIYIVDDNLIVLDTCDMICYSNRWSIK